VLLTLIFHSSIFCCRAFKVHITLLIDTPSVPNRAGATPQLAWALAQAQLQLPLSQAQPLLGLLAFPADLPADFCVNSVGNTFFAKIYPQEI